MEKGAVGRRFEARIMRSVWTESIAACSRVLLVAALTASVVAPALACDLPPAASTELRIDVPDSTSNIRDGWFLNVALDGGTPRRVQVDTGSVGLAIAAAAIPLSAKKLGPGSITYNSSGKTLAGDVYRVTIAFAGLTNVQTIAMPVLGVKSVSCNLAQHPNCVVAPGEANRIGVLGVGFGRHGSGADLADVIHMSEEAVNPFLQLTAMTSGTVRRAYSIFPDHIVFGIARDHAAGRWQTFPLARASDGDWKAVSGCVRAGSYAPSCTGGTTLVDTGVGTTILSVPGKPSAFVKPGTEITLDIGDAPAASFAFTATGSGCTGIALSCARWSHRTSLPIAINTSRRLIQAADYRFDDVCGAVSLRKTAERL